MSNFQESTFITEVIDEFEENYIIVTNKKCTKTIKALVKKWAKYVDEHEENDLNLPEYICEALKSNGISSVWESVEDIDCFSCDDYDDDN